MSVSRLVVRVRTNLEWVLGPDDNRDEQPIGMWEEHVRAQRQAPKKSERARLKLGSSA
jgi:hypothetical protein